MKQMLALTYNELLKIWKQAAFKVLIIILAALMILVPLAYKGISALSQSSDIFGAESRFFQRYFEDAEENGWYSEAAYYYTMIETDKVFKSNGKDNSVIRDEFESDLKFALTNEYISKKLLDKATTYEDLSKNDPGTLANFNYLYVQCYGIPEGLEEKLDVYDDYRQCYGDLGAFMTDEAVAGMYDEASSMVKDTTESILKFNFRDYYTDQYKYYQIYVSDLEESIASEDMPQQMIDTWTLQLEGYKMQCEAYGILSAKTGEYHDWEYNTMSIMETASMRLAVCVVVREEDYDEKMYGMPYEDYRKEVIEQQESWRIALKTAFYSIEHEIPSPAAENDSSKMHWNDEISIITLAGTMILIVITGMVVSNEYSSGTIRLLLIRPRRRSKILASKLISVMIYWVAMILASYIVTFVMNLILFGAGDIFAPDLFWNGKSVYQVNSLLSTLGMFFLSAVSKLPILLMAFLFSVLMKVAAPAIALPIVANSLLSSLQFTSIALYEVADWVVYLPFPYADLCSFVTNPLSPFMENSISLTSIVSLIVGNSISNFPIGIGIAYLVVLSVLEVVLSFVAFNKHQIKN